MQIVDRHQLTRITPELKVNFADWDSPKWLRNMLAGVGESPGVTISFATKDGLVVGFILFNANEIGLVEVAKSYRRQGVGRALVARAQRAGVFQELMCLPDAAPFWLSLGATGTPQKGRTLFKFQAA